MENRRMSHDLLIHPGETISELLEERRITEMDLAEMDLAQKTGISEELLSDVIHGRKAISEDLAMGLEYAFGVSKSFWLNLQANYDAEYLKSL